MRWYNPTLGDFEWREAPKSDKEALWLLATSPGAVTCIDTYQQ